jgi:hypothetical protein
MSKYRKMCQSAVHFFCQNRGKIAKNSKIVRLNSQGQFCLFIANLTLLLLFTEGEALFVFEKAGAKSQS